MRKRHDVEMLSFVAESRYLEGVNPLSIEAISSAFSRMLNQPIDLAAMREKSNRWEAEVTAAVEKDGELAERFASWRSRYDNELIESEGP